MLRIAGLSFRCLFWPCALGVLAACSEQPSSTPVVVTPAGGAGVTVYSGARLLVGDGNVIDNATFTVGPDNRFGLVGATAAVTVPAGVDDGRSRGPHSHARDRRHARASVARSRGAAGRSEAPRLLRRQRRHEPRSRQRHRTLTRCAARSIPGHALYRTAGRGFTAPEPGRTDIPYWITTADEARAGVREQAALGVDIIKIWVDDRKGQYPKLAPELYGAVIEEAHANNLRTIAHEYYLADAKELVRRGIDAFAHGVREPIDDEFVAMLKERPSFVIVPNLPDRGVAHGHGLAVRRACRRSKSRSYKPRPSTGPKRKRSSRFRRATSSASRARASRSRSAPTATCRGARISRWPTWSRRA